MTTRRAFLHSFGRTLMGVPVLLSACSRSRGYADVPAAPADVFTEGMHIVTSPDGTRIAARRSGSGAPLVLVHGTTADHTRWSRVSPAFEEGFTVYAVDRRGRGASGDATHYSLTREAEDIAAVIDSIDAPVNLLGHSYGAICSLEAAMRAGHLRSLILYEPPIPTGVEIVSAETRGNIERLLERDEREAALLTFFREVVRVPEPQLALMRAHPAWRGRVTAAHTLARELRIEAEYDLAVDRLRSLRTPTLLLVGGESPAFFHEATQRLGNELPDSRTHVLPGQQHVAMDSAPEAFVAAVRDFISAL